MGFIQKATALYASGRNAQRWQSFEASLPTRQRSDLCVRWGDSYRHVGCLLLYATFEWHFA